MATKQYPVIWLQGAGCTGCSVSILNAVSPKIQNLLLDELVPGKQINMRFHMTIMAGEGEPIIKVLRDNSRIYELLRPSILNFELLLLDAYLLHLL